MMNPINWVQNNALATVALALAVIVVIVMLLMLVTIVVLLAVIAMQLGQVVGLIKRGQRRNMWRQALQDMRYVPASNTFARRQPNPNRFAELGNMKNAGRTDIGGSSFAAMRREYGQHD